MSQLHDYSVWLTPERLEVEELAWEQSGIYRLYSHHVTVTADQENCTSVLEVGCGTGWLAASLPPHLKYLGVDANRNCIDLARRKSDRQFMTADVRDLEALFYLRDWYAPATRADLVCAFAFLKHFALDEWTDVFVRLLNRGRVAVFTMNVGEQDLDDFEQGFAHTWVSTDTLVAAITAAGHRLDSTALLHTGETMVKTAMPR